MALEPMAFRGLECTVCGRGDFRNMDQFKGHDDPAGRSCPGGTPG